jgi:hypothetical protein
MPQSNSGLSIVGTLALLVIGALIFIPSGLCTGVFLFGPMVVSLMNPGSGEAASGLAGVALIIGGPFVAVGGIMLWFGIRRVRAHIQARKTDANRIRDF